MNRRIILAASAVRMLPLLQAQLRRLQQSRLEPGAVANLLRKTSEIYLQASVRSSLQARFTSIRSSDVGSLPVLQISRVVLDGEWYRFERYVNGWNVQVAGPTGYWDYSEIRRQYVERTLDHPRVKEGRQLARDWAYRMGGRFGTLSRILVDAAFAGWSDVKTRAGRHRCALIRIEPQSSDGTPWTDTLAIDPETGLVWRSVMAHAAGSMETLWDSIVIGEPAAPGILVFRPPRNTRRVKEFESTVHGEH